jgi:hypothetical protein
MVNKSKIKGTAFESAIVKALIEAGHLHAERRALHGNTDRGDIAGIPGVVIESKNVQTITVGAFINEAEVEKTNAGASIGVAWVKLRGKAGAMDGAILMSPRQFLDILRRLGYLPEAGR